MKTTLLFTSSLSIKKILRTYANNIGKIVPEHCTMLDQGPPCFGHLAKSPFLVNMMGLAKLNLQDDLDKYIN